MSSYEQGRQARRDGLSLKQNPFPPEAPAPRAAWHEGWTDTDTILRSLGLA